MTEVEPSREVPRPAARRLVVDAMNVIGARPDGWWRDRQGAARRLVAALARLAARDALEVTVVLDGRRLPDLPEGAHEGIAVLYATHRGPNAADDRIARFVEEHPDPASLEVITSDRALAARVQASGASVSGAMTLRRRLDELE